MRAFSRVLADVRLFEDVLLDTQFNQFRQAVLTFADKELKDKDSYASTFWYPRGKPASNLVEECITEFYKLVKPPAECIGTEWWFGRLGFGKKLRYHFDRDLALSRESGGEIFPIFGSVFYLNDYPSSPTVILDQVPGSDGKSLVPEQAKVSVSVHANSNHYVRFPGNLYHGVIPDKSILERERKSGKQPSEPRLTLLVNYWHKRPSPPVCNDYDGSVYQALNETRTPSVG